MKNGVPSECFQNTHEVPINDVEALETMIKKYENEGGVAAFIMEAVGQDSGAVPTTKEYHKAARELCDKYGMLLIYDEVVTGFRLGMGGAQSIFGTKPDLTVFGKSLVADMQAPAVSAAERNHVHVDGWCRC